MIQNIVEDQIQYNSEITAQPIIWREIDQAEVSVTDDDDDDSLRIKEKVLEKRIATSLLYPTIRDGSKAMYSAGSDITPWRITDRQCRRK